MPTLFELAEYVKGSVIGDPNVQISGVSGVDDAKPGDIALVASLRGVERAVLSQAAALIVPANLNEVAKPAIKVANPRLAFAQILEYFAPKRVCQVGIHPSAVIGDNFNGEGVSVGAQVYIGHGVTIGKGSIIAPGVVIEDNVRIGENTTIHANVVIREDTVIGSRVQIHAGTVIGADGFGYVTVDSKHVKIPQLGRVVIEDDVEIGACVTVDRATTGVTLIKRGSKIDNLVQIAHNCQIGEDNIIIAQVGIAGATKLGDRVTMAGKSSIVGHLQVGDDSVIAAHALVINSLPSNSFVSGVPARPHAVDMRIQASAGRLPDVLKELKELQKKVAELEGKIHS